MQKKFPSGIFSGTVISWDYDLKGFY